MLGRTESTLWWNTRMCRSVFSANLQDSLPLFDAESGMMIPGVNNEKDFHVHEVHKSRHVTWEDTLNIHEVHLDRSDKKLLNQSFHACVSPHCMHVGVPLSVQTRIRPVRAFVDAHNSSRFTVPIEKVASSSLKREYGYEHLRRCGFNDAIRLFAHMSNSTACNYAGSFVWNRRLTSVAIVRHPFRRFLSSLVDHGTLNCSAPNCQLLSKAKSLIGRLASKRFDMKLFPPAAMIHMYTQSYFLSATNVDGAPILWTRIDRMEENPPIKFAENKKESYTHIVDYLVQDKTLRCDICRVYRQDFVCFGYTGCEDCDHTP